jgi:Fic family protein
MLRGILYELAKPYNTRTMDATKFTSQAPGRLVPIDDGVAFLPKETEEARGALGELNGVGRILPNPNVLVYPYLHREALLSSMIEGTQATLSDVFLHEAKETSDASVDVQEVLNYVQAMMLGLHEIKTMPLCLNLLKKVHERILSGRVRGQHRAPGQFRRSQTFIGPPGAPIAAARYVPPPINEMDACLDAWEKYLHVDDELPPLLRCALLHYQFEAIHPFYDGNGRVGRIAIILYLMEQQLLERPLLYISAYFEQNRPDYYSALLAVSQEGDWDAWLTFFLRGVKAQAQAASEDCQRLLNVRADITNGLTAIHARPTAFRIIDYLFVNPYVTTTVLARRLKLTFRAVQMAIDQLIEVGWLEEVTGNKRNRLYKAQRVLDAITGGWGEALAPDPEADETQVHTATA